MRIIKNNQIDFEPSLKVVKQDNRKKESQHRDAEVDKSVLAAILKAKEKEIALKKERILSEAKEEAQRVLKTAKKNAQSLMDTAKERGYNAGYEEGLKLGYEEGYKKRYQEDKKKIDKLFQEAQSLKLQAQKDYEKLLASAEQDMVTIVMEVARKFIKTEMSNNKDHILLLIKEAIAKCSHREELVVRISAQDYDYINDNRDRLMAGISGIKDLTIVAEENMKPGSCVVESDYGSTDSGVDTRLKLIEEAFLRLLSQKSLQDK